jgi:hypothetical protein
VKSWTPTRLWIGEGRVRRGGNRQMPPSRSTGVLGTARWKGGAGKRGIPVAARVAASRFREGRRESDRAIVPLKPGNSGGGKDPDFWRALEDDETEVIGRGFRPANTVDGWIRPKELCCKAKALRAGRARTRAAGADAVGLAVKLVGEPYAGNPHVRFDERGEETERLPHGSSHRASLRLYTTGGGYGFRSPRPSARACHRAGQRPDPVGFAPE